MKILIYIPKINEQLEKDINSKSKELEKIKKRVNEESTNIIKEFLYL